VLCGASFLSSRLGFFGNLETMSAGEKGMVAALGLFVLWVVIDNGFLQGTVGPNRYGPDPIGRSSTGSAAVPARRPAGAYVRDGVVALVGVLVLGFWAAPRLGAPPLLTWIFDRLLLPTELAVFREQRANEPAFEAHRAGSAAARAGKPEEAIEHYSRAIALYGADQRTAALSYRWRAEEHRKVGKLELALVDYTKSSALEPAVSSTHYYRGLILRDLERYSEALAAFDKALQHDPDDAFAYIRRGQSLEKLDRTQEALAAYSEAVTAASREYQRRLKLWERTESDKSEQAPWRAKLREQRDNTLAVAHVRRGTALAGLARPDEAMKEYATALQIRPDDRNAYLNRGWLHERNNQRELARADYEKAATLAAPDEWLRRALERTK
jgi:tetratricopeptide (TPR) repeat protein